MIYTCYFAKLKSLPGDVVPISICAKAPEWYRGLQYKKLAPKYDFFMEWKRTRDNDYYIRCFDKQVTGKLSATKVVNELSEILHDLGYYDKDICLICYEKPSDFCHRHLVAKWLTDNGYRCEEW